MRVKNWSHFQHYKHRRPPWIKLYRELLDDPEYHALEPSAAKLLPLLWLIASEKDGELPASDVLAFRVRLASDALARCLGCLKHWLEGIPEGSAVQHDMAPGPPNASVVLATCKQPATPETEKSRVETEAEGPTSGPESDHRGSSDFALTPEPEDKPKAADAQSRLCLNRETWQWENIKRQDIEAWHLAYPAVDIEGELLRAIQWVKAAGAKGHKSNWGRFLSSWFSRRQDRGGSMNGYPTGGNGATTAPPPTQKPPKPESEMTPEEWEDWQRKKAASYW